MAAYDKPLPRGEDFNGEFYRFCKDHELRFQRYCGAWRHMPRESCQACGSNWTWERTEGKGQVFSWTVIHRALHPGFAEALPYAAVVVELEEGVRKLVPVDELPLGVEGDDVTPDVSTVTQLDFVQNEGVSRGIGPGKMADRILQRGQQCPLQP